jgi:2-methylcitrate dehydratase PrpD
MGAHAEHPQPAFERQLCDYISTSLDRPLPAEADERAKLHILDTLAAIVSGSRLLPGEQAISYVGSQGGTPEALVIGSSIMTSAVNAALVNGMSAHADETDDSSAAGAMHPGCIVLPAAFAAAQKWKRSGCDLMRATALGYDLAVRFALALGAYKFHNAGHAVPGFCGVFAAAGAASALAGLDVRKTGAALSYAAQQASGLSSWRRDADHIEKAFVFGGMPARNGTAAVTMVASGMTGVVDVFSGKPNFLGTFSVVGAEPAALIDGLGTDFQIARTTIKKWCVGSPVQPALDAVEALMPQGLQAENLKRLRITLPTTALTIVDKTTMPDLNIRNLVGALLVNGRLTFDMIHDHAQLMHPDVLAIASRIDVIGSEELEALRPQRQAIVEADMADGRILQKRVHSVRGTIENPMTPAEVHAKAFDLFAPVLSDARARKLVETVDALDRQQTLDGLADLLTVR